MPEYHYSLEMLDEWSSILTDLTGICFNYQEVELILDNLHSHKQKIIGMIENL